MATLNWGDGESAYLDDADSDDTNVAVEFDGDQYRCGACSEPLRMNVGSAPTDSEGETLCPSWEWDPDADPDDMHEGPHKPVRVPLTWCNSAGVVAEPDSDSVTVKISVGDPRGAFTMTVYRLPDDHAEFPGRLVMHVPHPDVPLLHAPLTPYGSGYMIGH